MKHSHDFTAETIGQRCNTCTNYAAAKNFSYDESGTGDVLVSG